MGDLVFRVRIERGLVCVVAFSRLRSCFRFHETFSARTMCVRAPSAVLCASAAHFRFVFRINISFKFVVCFFPSASVFPYRGSTVLNAQAKS